MKCRTCGQEVTSGSVYCPKCGDRVVDDAAQIKSAPAWAEGAAAEGIGAGNDPAADNKSQSGKDKASARSGGQRPQAADRLKSGAPASTAAGEEEDVWRGGYSAHAMWGYWLLAILVTIALPIGAALLGLGQIMWIVVAAIVLLVWLVLGCVLLYRKLNVDYRLTNQRFTHRVGILRRVVDRIEVIDIDDITFEQGLIDRFSGVGTIIVTSSDRTHPTLKMPGIARVEQVADAIDTTRRKERAARSIHIETI